MHGRPGQNKAKFKFMLIEGDWKYIYMSNGGREQLFNLRDDPHELRQRLDDDADVARRLRRDALAQLKQWPTCAEALDGDDLRAYDFEPMPRKRLLQMDSSIGVLTYSHRWVE
jgi:choline-sulfatase